MRFKARELKDYAEPVTAGVLKKGTVYFSVQFQDSDLQIPTVVPLIFLGKNLVPGRTDRYYFQTFESYRQGVRYNTATKRDQSSFQVATEVSMKHIFEYERALDVLLSCALKRASRAAGKD